MKRILLSIIVAVASVAFVPGEVEAKRLGGGGTSGLKRQTPPPQTPDAPAAKQAAPAQPANTANAAPAAAPKRSWMGPLAGLAAGLGLAALMSHLGMGAEFGSILTMLLLGLVGIFAIRFLMNRFGRARAEQAPQGLQFAGAGAGFQQAPSFGSGSSGPSNVTALQPAAATSSIPAGFDAAGFERAAKMIFIRMQAANDSADLNDLRAFTTPEMFAAVKIELQERANAPQTTDVVRIDAEVLDVVSEEQRQIVSVRFHGLIREEKDGVAAPFDEIWHLVKPADGSREWAIAGIQQAQVA